jgi:hypothetical protein
VVRIHSGALRILRPHRYLAVWPFCVRGVGYHSRVPNDACCNWIRLQAAKRSGTSERPPTEHEVEAHMQRFVQAPNDEIVRFPEPFYAETPPSHSPMARFSVGVKPSCATLSAAMARGSAGSYADHPWRPRWRR